MLLEIQGIFSDFLSGGELSQSPILILIPISVPLPNFHFHGQQHQHLGTSRIHLVYMLMRGLIGASSKQTGSYKNLHLTNAKYSGTTTTTTTRTRATNAIR